MKKNLLSILILSLLVINIIMTAIMLFSVVGTNRKTAAIVTDIAGILSLEMADASGNANAVSMEATEAYTLSGLTITAKRAEGDTKDSYCIVDITLSINKEHEDYAKYGGEAMAGYADHVKSEIISVITQYTVDEIKLSQDAICQEILKRIQQKFGSDVIFDVSISNIMYG
ncbi:MAG: flagellar basal body-associated FliL family protein [Lachnospiraceae bacterium]|nr:flagellar basal body-associated FliL family protein [Lachnospiraceae bacterium]